MAWCGSKHQIMLLAHLIPHMDTSTSCIAVKCLYFHIAGSGDKDVVDGQGEVTSCPTENHTVNGQGAVVGFKSPYPTQERPPNEEEIIPVPPGTPNW